MGFRREEEMLETQAKIAKKCGRLDTWLLEKDTGEEPKNVTEKVWVSLPKAGSNAGFCFFRVEGNWAQQSCQKIFFNDF